MLTTMTQLAKDVDFVLNAALYFTSSMSAGNGSLPQEGINPTSSRAQSNDLGNCVAVGAEVLGGVELNTS